MKRSRILLAGLFALLLLCAPQSIIPINTAVAASAQNQKNEVSVWVNTASGVYHCPGDRWYGQTKAGKYMGECEAQKAGYRPSRGKPCGSACLGGH